MKFDFNDYKVEYAMHCKTEKEAEEFCKVLYDARRKWSTGSSYKDITNYGDNKTRTCYSFNHGNYGNFDYYERANYTILEWEDFMEFTKDDLKIGYVVQFENGAYAMFVNTLIGLVFITQDGVFVKLTDYKGDLTTFSNTDIEESYSIVKVFGFSRLTMATLNITPYDRELLWERKEPKELTMQEIADKFGVDVKDLKIKK